jgi:hypothetical protein
MLFKRKSQTLAEVCHRCRWIPQFRWIPQPPYTFLLRIFLIGIPISINPICRWYALGGIINVR